MSPEVAELERTAPAGGPRSRHDQSQVTELTAAVAKAAPSDAAVAHRSPRAREGAGGARSGRGRRRAAGSAARRRRPTGPHAGDDRRARRGVEELGQHARHRHDARGATRGLLQHVRTPAGAPRQGVAARGHAKNQRTRWPTAFKERHDRMEARAARACATRRSRDRATIRPPRCSRSRSDRAHRRKDRARRSISAWTISTGCRTSTRLGDVRRGVSKRGDDQPDSARHGVDHRHHPARRCSSRGGSNRSSARASQMDRRAPRRSTWSRACRFRCLPCYSSCSSSSVHRTTSARSSGWPAPD